MYIILLSNALINDLVIQNLFYLWDWWIACYTKEADQNLLYLLSYACLETIAVEIEFLV